MAKFTISQEVALSSYMLLIQHKFLVSLANSPSTFSSMINSVISLLPRFGSKQTKDNVATEKQIQTVIENREAFSNNDNAI